MLKKEVEQVKKAFQIFDKAFPEDTAPFVLIIIVAVLARQ